MSRTCLNNESMQFDAQFMLLTVVFLDQSLLTINTMKYATHNAIWNTLQLSHSEHYPDELQMNQVVVFIKDDAGPTLVQITGLQNYKSKGFSSQDTLLKDATIQQVVVTSW